MLFERKDMARTAILPTDPAAVKVWSANVEARLELGLLYLDTNRVDEAQQTYTELRPLNATYASTLLEQINKRKH